MHYFSTPLCGPWRNMACLLVAAMMTSGCVIPSSGQSSPNTPTTPTTPTTSKAYLDVINDLEAKNPTGSSDDVIVSVFDTGIDANHESLAGKVIGGLDFIANDPNSKAHLQDSHGHGTHIAGLIAANDVSGVAPDAKLLAYRIIQDNATSSRAEFVTDAEVGLAYRHALASGSYIYNNSWGTDTHLGNTTAAAEQVKTPQVLAQAQKNVDAGGVFVFAAGNNSTSGHKKEVRIEAGLPYYFPGLKPGWLAVAATNDNTINGSGSNLLADYSNQCGLAKDWCLAAPGGGEPFGLNSLSAGGGTTLKQGTSMATGIVSGSLAVLLAKFGSASFNAQDAAARLLVSANKEGIYSNTDLYGQGLLDLSAALTLIGTASIPQGATLTSHQKTDVSRTTLALPIAAQGAIASQLPNGNMLVVDSFQSVPFQIPVKDLMNSSTNHSVFDPQPLYSGPITSPSQSLTLLPSLRLVVDEAASSFFGNNKSTLWQLQWQSSQIPLLANKGFVYGMVEHRLAVDESTPSHSVLEAGLQVSGTQIYSNYQTDNTYSQAINTSGAFAQSTSGLINYGVRIKQPWSLPNMDTTFTVEQSRWQPEQGINRDSLWQWHNNQNMTSMRLDARYQPAPASHHMAGGYLQVQKYQGNDAATVRLPYAFEQDSSVAYKTIALSGAHLFDQDSAGLFWQWSNNPRWGVKAQVMVKRQGDDTQTGVQIEWASSLGQQQTPQ